MEPILDETSLVPCQEMTPGSRIATLASTLRALDDVGSQRVLRSVRDAADRDIADGRGLRSWCFAPSTSRDAGRLVASRLASQPFIDGTDGLFARAEGNDAIETRVAGNEVFGLGLVAITNDLAIAIASAHRPVSERIAVVLSQISATEERQHHVSVLTYVTPEDVLRQRQQLISQAERALRTGADILRLLPEVFPALILGADAQRSISKLSGNEPVFRQLVRHLRALQHGAEAWQPNTLFAPVAVRCSEESDQTLNHRVFGPQRDFTTPPGYAHRRWSWHTKLTGGAEARLYFRAERKDGISVVLIGYFGDHLPTVNFRT